VDFIAFPVRIGGNGWLVRADSPEESIVQLLRIIVSTPQGGWRGSAVFGMRDMLAGLGSGLAARLAAVTQLNHMLEDLGIDWVRVETIAREPAAAPYSSIHAFTLSFTGRGTETHRIAI
jgi:hypothetical protein